MTESLENRAMNRTVAFVRNFVNSVYACLEKIDDNREVFLVIVRDLIKLLAPIIPHLCEEAWSMFEFEGLVSNNQWPSYEKEYLVASTINMPIQVNGKLRGSIDIGLDEPEDAVFEKALQLAAVQKAIDGKPIRKKIFVKGKIINFVV